MDPALASLTIASPLPTPAGLESFWAAFCGGPMPSLSGGRLGCQDPAVMPTREPPPPSSQAQRSAGRLRLGSPALCTEKCPHSRDTCRVWGKPTGRKPRADASMGVMQGPRVWTVVPWKMPPLGGFSLDPREDSPCGGGNDSGLPCQGRLLGGGCL